MAMSVDEGRQHRAALGIQHVLPFRDQQPLTYGGNFAVAQPEFHRLSGTVLCVADQHGKTSCFVLVPAAMGELRAKKNFSQKREKSKSDTLCGARKEHPIVHFEADGTARHGGAPLPLHRFYLLYHAMVPVSMRGEISPVRDFMDFCVNFWTI